MNKDGKTAVIIGGGLGGLFTGAMFSRLGYAVTVLEKNRTAGGGLQNFSCRGTVFDTGMHVVGGFGEGGSLMRICSWLGILDSLSMTDAPADCMDTITYLSDGRTYRLASGREGFVESLSREFPEEKEGIAAYVDRLYALAGEIPLFHVRNAGRSNLAHSEDFFMPADQLIDRYVRDPRLKDVLAYMNTMYGGWKGHTPAYVHAVINVLYINGSSRFNGGGQQLADALVGVIGKGGGRVLTGNKAVRVRVEDRAVTAVEAEDGKVYTGGIYVSAIHPLSLLDIIDRGAFPPSYASRLKSIPSTYSAFVVFIKFKKNTFPYLPSPEYCQVDYGHFWDGDCCRGDLWPAGFMAMTPPDSAQGPWADRMTVNCIMDYGEVRRWENTYVGHRGDDYLRWKEAHVAKVLSRLAERYPGIEDCIEYAFGASPLTVRDYYGTFEGSMYGYAKDSQNLPLSYIPVRTKVRNLLLTGQNVNLHGICGVPLTAIETVEAVEGFGTIVDKINENYYGYRI